ncbi:MAG TPA: hypothetical protein VF765_14780, partial [Polyangiaceae bacterium]
MHLPRLTLIGLVASSALALATTGCGQGDTGGAPGNYGMGGGGGGVTGPGTAPGSSSSGGSGSSGAGSSGGS